MFSQVYRCLIKGFSSIAKLHYRLTEKKAKFVSTDDFQKLFLKLKQVLSTPPILAFPCTDLPFILDTDVSNHEIGAVLSQVQVGI